MKDNRKFWQRFSVITLIIAVSAILVGFAAMAQSLNITGQSKVNPGEWDIKFTSAVFSANNTKAYKIEDNTDPSNPKPNLSGTSFSNYEIVLTKPGDKGTYTLTLKNAGNIDAQLTDVSLNTGNLTYEGQATDAAAKENDEKIVARNVIYTVTWEDGSAITEGSTLDANEEKKIIITAEYDSEADELPSKPVVITGRNLILNYTSK